MSAPKPKVTIVGLGEIGGSIGLALRQADVVSAVVGHDKEVSVAKAAKKLGAVDQTDWNLISACEDSDLVILSIPFGDIEPTLKALGSYLRPGCVLMDTATLKEPVLAWADEILPDEIHFVGSNPVIVQSVEGQGGLESARVDLFQNGLFCLTPSPKADPKAVKLATDLITILGAKPVFFDAAEHDGMMAGVEHLPPILALSLLEVVTRQPSWRDMRRVAGGAFGAATYLPAGEPIAYGDLIQANRDNVLRWLDAFSASLASVRQLVAEGEPEAIAEHFNTVLEERERWMQDRASGNWEGDRQELPEKPNILRDAFLGGLGRKRPQKKEE